MILCGPFFAISLCLEPKIISLKSPQFQFYTQMFSNDDDINVLNVCARKESRLKVPKI